MLSLATPISHLFKNDSFADLIGPVTDCFEVRDHTMKSDLPKQYLYHCDLQPIHPWTEEEFTHLKLVKKNKPELKLITFHCASCCDKPEFLGKIWILGGNKYSEEEMLRNAKNNFIKIREIFGNDIAFAIENNNYYKTSAYDSVCQPYFITKVIEQNNLNLLLDLAHAQISASNMDMSFHEYINGLPLERVIQIHICSPAKDENGNLYDAHQLPCSFEINEALEISKKYNPKYLTLEYYRSIEEVKDSLIELKRIFA